MVAAMSGGSTGRSAGTAPMGSLAPTIRPPCTPPPAKPTVKHCGQWSRPPAGFTRGVRPNSARLQTRVASRSPALVEVFDQRAISLIIQGANDVAHPFDRGEGLRAVDVPGDFVENGQERVDRHESYAVLDQSTGEQAALAEPGHPVAFANRLGLFGEIKRLAGLRAGHQAEGCLKVAVEEGGVFARFEEVDGVVDEVADLPASVESNGADLLGREQVGHFEAGLRGVGMELEGVVRFAEESAGLAVRHVAAAATHEFGEHGEGRQVGLPSSQIAHDRADVGCIDSPGEEPACLHHLPACVVNRGTAVVDRADERDLIGDFGDSREDFGEPGSREPWSGSV